MKCRSNSTVILSHVIRKYINEWRKNFQQCILYTSVHGRQFIVYVYSIRSRLSCYFSSNVFIEIYKHTSIFVAHSNLNKVHSIKPAYFLLRRIYDAICDNDKPRQTIAIDCIKDMWLKKIYLINPIHVRSDKKYQ